MARSKRSNGLSAKAGKPTFPSRYVDKEGVFVPAKGDAQPFDYSDGDQHENHLLQIIGNAKDRSLYSPEMKAGIKDWPSRYHLSPKRANLLRPFAPLLRGAVLEVGAGCGAITRFLGENGGQIIAVEPSARRARIARDRTSDLTNVQVVCDRFENVIPETPIDVVTVVGVLEYAGVYGLAGGDPHLDFLKLLSKRLSVGGVVILAIENQLGLKYFAGAREDHTGRPFHGLNDSYGERTVATFGRAELSDLLNRAGLGSQAWYVPCPDYKLPNTVISDRLIADDPALAATLLAQATTADPQNPSDPMFSLEQGWALLGRNDLLGALANSFLVVAGASSEAIAPYLARNEIAWHYSVDRHPAFVKEARFVRTAKNITVKRKHLTAVPPPAVPIHSVIADEPLRKGENWWNALAALLNKQGWTAADIAEWATIWTDALVRECGIEALTGETIAKHVDGRHFDAVPFNMARDHLGRSRFFDQEWHLKPSLELGYIVFRGLRDSLARVSTCAEPAPETPLELHRLITVVLAELGILVTRTEIDRYAMMERQVQAWVQGRIASEATPGDLQAEWGRALRQRAPAERAAMIHERQTLTDRIARAQTTIERETEARHATAAELEQTRGLADERAAEIAALIVSRDALHRRAQELDHTIEATRGLLRNSQTETQRLAGEVAERDERISSLADELATTRDALTRTAADHDAAQQQVDRLSTEVERLAAFPAKLDAAESQRRNVEDHAKRLEAERDTDRDARRQAEEERDAKARDAATASAQSEQLRVNLLQQAEALAALTPKRRLSVAAASRALATHFSRWKSIDFGQRKWEVELIRASGLFSPLAYLQRYPDVVESGLDPLLHYIRHGSAEGRAPHALFDGAYYLKRYPEAAEAKMSALAHYISAGVPAGFDPHPLFDTAWYLEQNPDVAAAGVNPLHHYMEHGWREGRDPHPLFDTSWYLEQNPDVANAGENPLVHYLIFGWKEGRNPHPEFDSSWYLEQNEDVADAGENPLKHYIEFGKQERRRPHPNFSKLNYLENRSNTIPRHPTTTESEKEYSTKSTSLFNRLSTKNIITPSEDICFPNALDPDISIIIPVCNQLEYTLDCLRSISEQQCKYPFEIIIMDDNSSDQTPEILSRISGIRYFRNKDNIGFNRNCNRGADLARGKHIVFLNNDTKVLPGWLQALRDTFDEHSNIGIVGSKLIYNNGRLQEAGGIIWEDGSGWNWGRLQDPKHPRYNFVRDVDYLSGASLMVCRALFFKVGKFSDKLENSYYEDTWLAFAAREAGYRVIYQPKSELIHYEGITSGRDESQGIKRYQALNRGVFFERWKNELQTHLPNAITPEAASDRLPKSHILIIDACTPTPDQDSGSIDMFNLIKILQNAGFRVHFIPQSNFSYFGEYTKQLQSMGVECIYAPYYRDTREFLSERGDVFSHVILVRTPIAETVFDDVEELTPTAKIIFYTVDMHGLRELREAELESDDARVEIARETLRKELVLVDRSDVTVVLSEYEAAYLRDRGYNNITVVPLIRDYTFPLTVSAFDQRADVIFIGGFQHTPNTDAVIWLCNEIWPNVRRITRERGLPTIRLKIVGSKMPDWIKTLATDDIEPIGFVEDLDGVFSKVRLSIAPLRFGAGLKGKIATSLGFGVPTIGTPIAFEGMSATGLNDIRFCANTAEEIANGVVDLYGDAVRWNAASLAGVNYVARHYSLQAASSKIETILADSADSASPKYVNRIAF